MPEQLPVSIDDVRAMVAERHRFDDWLSALEARRAETPEHVYARVHGDYRERRERILVQLRAQTPLLSELLTSLDVRASDLAGRMRALEDERTEAMLRHAVGEYDDAAWHTVRERVEASLLTMESEHGALESQRADVRQLLAEAQPQGIVGVDGATAPDGGAGELPLVTDRERHGWLEGEAPAPPVGGAQAETPVAPVSGAQDRLLSITEMLAAIEADVVDEASVSDTPAVDALPRPPQPAGEEPRPNAWGAPPTGAQTAAPDDPDETPDLYGNATSDRGVAAPPAESFDELAFLRSVIESPSSGNAGPKGADTDTPQKTLRCTECGTMNRPTEWYCERCGGELATF
jgi:hypothetical protein